MRHFPKFKHKAVNTSDIYLHNNIIRHTARFGISLRHKPSAIKGITDTPLDYDNNVRIINNRCEDLGGSCVLMNGVWKGLLEKNLFIRSGALVEPELSVNRGSGAWFFRRYILLHNTILLMALEDIMILLVFMLILLIRMYLFNITSLMIMKVMALKYWKKIKILYGDITSV